MTFTTSQQLQSRSILCKKSHHNLREISKLRRKSRRVLLQRVEQEQEQLVRSISSISSSDYEDIRHEKDDGKSLTRNEAVERNCEESTSTTPRTNQPRLIMKRMEAPLE